MALLVTEHLHKRFGETRAVDDVSLTIHPRELVSLVGANGAGKTTLVNLVSGLLAPDSGRIVFQGADVTYQPVPQRIRAGIARSFQLVNLFDQLTALDNVRLAVFARDGKIRTATALAERDAAARDEAMAILEQFGLLPKWHLPAASLAQGERKLLDVAVAYALRPQLILLDEPTSGVGTREKGRIMDTVSGVCREGGLTAVIVEHDMDIVFTYSDRIVVMHQGQILADGPPQQIREDERVATTLLGRY
ncbi:MAG: ABC transporter ATP-binding protein [Armatimonadota bacterium]|nr:ABC transporter ATP-binding protein [Armatimonadota bacterium]MDR7534849.1 ABC transporter ATP-binding protein [Armatimonadota bacterium]